MNLRRKKSVLALRRGANFWGINKVIWIQEVSIFMAEKGERERACMRTNPLLTMVHQLRSTVSTISYIEKVLWGR